MRAIITLAGRLSAVSRLHIRNGLQVLEETVITAPQVNKCIPQLLNSIADVPFFFSIAEI